MFKLGYEWKNVLFRSRSQSDLNTEDSWHLDRVPYDTSPKIYFCTHVSDVDPSFSNIYSIEESFTSRTIFFPSAKVIRAMRIKIVDVTPRVGNSYVALYGVSREFYFFTNGFEAVSSFSNIYIYIS